METISRFHEMIFQTVSRPWIVEPYLLLNCDLFTTDASHRFGNICENVIMLVGTRPTLITA